MDTDLFSLAQLVGSGDGASNSTGNAIPSDAETPLSSGEIATVIVKLLIYIFGTIGNILVIFVILYLSEYKKITHWYVLQLAIADLVFLQTLAVTISVNIEQNWVHHESMCKAKEAILFINYYASITFLMIMAIDRYLAVCHGLSNRVQRLRSPKISYIVTALTWIAVVLLSIPIMLYSKLVGNENNCRCELRFPIDARMWCIEQSYTTEADIARCMEEDFNFGGKDRDNQCITPAGGGFGGFPFPIGPGENSSAVDFAGTSSHGNGSSVNTGGMDLLGGIDLGHINPDGDPLGPSASSSSASANSFNSNPGVFDYAGGGGLLGLGADSSSSSANSFNSNPSTLDYGDVGGIDWNSISNGSGHALGNNGTTSSLSGGGLLSPGCIYSKNRPWFPGFIIFNFIVMFWVPLLVIVVCYSLIVLHLKKTMIGGRRSSVGETTHSTTDGSRKIVKKKRNHSSVSRSTTEKRRVTVMCAVLVVLFAVCWLPFHAVHIAKLNGIAGVSSEFCGMLGIASTILAYLNSALNPYLYNFLGTFKKRIKQIQKHERTRSLISATRLTRAGTRSISAGSSSEGSRMKRSSMANDRPSSVMPNETNPLTYKEQNETTKL